MNDGERARRAKARQLAYQIKKARWIAEHGADQFASLFEYSTAVKERILAAAPGVIFDGARILEVGAGPHGHVFFWDHAGAIGLDPLAGPYARFFPQFQKHALTVAGAGEALPFADAAFDLVVSDNVVDHAENPRAIVAEMARVLKPGGVFYFTVHVHHPVWSKLAVVHDALRARVSSIEIPAFSDHTVHYTESQARALLDTLGLTTLSETVAIAEAKLRSPWRSFVWKNARFERIARKPLTE